MGDGPTLSGSEQAGSRGGEADGMFVGLQPAKLAPVGAWESASHQIERGGWLCILDQTSRCPFPSSVRCKHRPRRHRGN
jgi:hypothetical protein